MFDLAVGLQCVPVAEWLRQMYCSMPCSLTPLRVRFESDRFISASENWNKPRIEPTTSELKG